MLNIQRNRANMNKKLLPDSIIQMIWKAVRFLDLGCLILRFYPKSILRTDGWFKSFRLALPIDNKNDPIPWYTYSFIKFIEPRITQNMHIFEYGCGNSTIWYSKKAEKVCAVENNAQWEKQISKKLPENSIVYLREKPEDYIQEIKERGLFDIVVIDGVFRDQCCLPAIEQLKEDGVIIWDNTDREDFNLSYPLLQKYGFKEIYFYGMVPGTFVASQTSVLYRSNNCLGI